MEQRSPFDRERSRLLRSVYSRLEEVRPSPEATMAALRLLDQIIDDWQPTPWLSVDDPGSAIVHWRVKKEEIGLRIEPDGSWELWHNKHGSPLDNIADGGPDGIIDPDIVAQLHKLFFGMGRKVADVTVGWGPASKG